MFNNPKNKLQNLLYDYLKPLPGILRDNDTNKKQMVAVTYNIVNKYTD